MESPPFTLQHLFFCPKTFCEQCRPPPLTFKPHIKVCQSWRPRSSDTDTQQCFLHDKLSSFVRLADEIMQGAVRAGGEGGAGRGLTERSQSLLLINHCSVFDLSFAKGTKRGGGGWPLLLLLTLSRKEGQRARLREREREEEAEG